MRHIPHASYTCDPCVFEVVLSRGNDIRLNLVTIGSCKVINFRADTE